MHYWTTKTLMAWFNKYKWGHIGMIAQSTGYKHRTILRFTSIYCTSKLIDNKTTYSLKEE